MLEANLDFSDFRYAARMDAARDDRLGARPAPSRRRAGCPARDWA
jgi:hypothetical protein